MINKDTIKFQIKIFLQFYWRAKEVPNIVFLRILVKSFDKSHHLCTLHITGYFFCCTIIKIQACWSIKIVLYCIYLLSIVKMQLYISKFVKSRIDKNNNVCDVKYIT